MHISQPTLYVAIFAMGILMISAFTIPNNQSLTDVTKPDLMVRDIDFPEGYKVGTCTDVKVAIGNLSEKSAGKFKVELYLSENNQPVTKLYQSVKGLGPKRTTWITFKDVKVRTKEIAKLQITSDVTKIVSEANEYNNKKLIYPEPKSGCKGGFSLIP